MGCSNARRAERPARWRSPDVLAGGRKRRSDQRRDVVDGRRSGWSEGVDGNATGGVSGAFPSAPERFVGGIPLIFRSSLRVQIPSGTLTLGWAGSGVRTRPMARVTPNRYVAWPIRKPGRAKRDLLDKIGSVAMKGLLVSDIHYRLKQLDWLASVASSFDLVVIAGRSSRRRFGRYARGAGRGDAQVSREGHPRRRASWCARAITT